MYTVVGVLKEKAKSEEGSEDDKVMIPYTSAARMSMVSTYYFSAKDEKTVDKALEVIQSFLFKKFSNTNAYSVSSMDAMVDTLDEVTGKMTLMLVAIAGISLLVGGIGIMNIMLVSVTERTREIGIRMAIGAKAWDIRWQFLMEAMVLSMLGGLFGVIIGLIGSELVSIFTTLSAKVSVFYVLLPFSFAGLVGLFFGFYPAYKASLLNPINALRYE